MTFSVRDFAPGDTDAILALNMHAQNPDADIASSLRHYPELLDIPANFQRDGAFIVGALDGLIIAMGSITPADESVFEIDYIRVAIPHQRRGYARAVMQGLEASVLDLGGAAAILRVSADNTAARTLYESLGYLVDIAADTVYDVDGNAFHPVRYRKELFSLSTLAKMRDDLLARVVEALRADSRVTAAWLCGSFGRGERDQWSDLDLHVLVDDRSLQSLLDAPEELFSLGGEQLLIQGNFPSDSLPGGRFWLVEYQGPVEVDWNIGPAGRGVRPAASMLLFEKSPVAIAEDRPTELPETLRTRAQRDIEFFWAMAPIAVKYGGRGHTRLAVAQCSLLEQAFVSLWRAVNHPAALHDEFHQNRLIDPALDELLPRFGFEIDAPATLTVVSLFCVRAEQLHPALRAVGVRVPEKMPKQVTRMLRVAMDESRRGGTGPAFGSRR